MIKKTFKFAIYIFQLFIFENGFSQDNKAVLRGDVDVSSKYKFAFLYQVDTKTRIVTPISEHKFIFELPQSSNLVGKQCYIFLGTDSSRTFADARHARPYGEVDYKSVMIEKNVVVHVNGEINKAQVIGGRLNKDLIEMFRFIEEGNYLGFFSDHTDSTVSLILLNALFALKDVKYFPLAIDYKEQFSRLSEKVRNSDEGRKTWEKINKESIFPR